MRNISSKIMKLVESDKSDNRVFKPKDFFGLGATPNAVYQALARLQHAGKLRRISRGLYARPQISELLGDYAPVSIDAVLDAVGSRDHCKILPDGHVAAYALGLTTAVPVRPSYITDGYTRTVDIDGLKVTIRHRGPRLMRWSNTKAMAAVQALYWLGHDGASQPDVATNLGKKLSHQAKRDLKLGLNTLPAWCRPIVSSIVSSTHGQSA